MSFLKNLFGKENSSEGREHVVIFSEDEQIDHAALSAFLSSLDSKNIPEELKKGSPRLRPQENKAIDLEKDYLQWKQFAKDLQSASRVVVCGHMDGLGDAIHHLRYSIAIALAHPHKQIFHLIRNDEVIDKAALPPNVHLVKTNPQESLMEQGEVLDDSTFVFNPSLYQPILRKQFGSPESTPIFAETQRGREGFDLMSCWYYTVAKTPNSEPNRMLRRMREKTKDNLYYTDACHQSLDQASKLRWLLGIDELPENFLEVPILEPNLVENPANVVLIIDAAEGKGEKLLSPSQWAQYIVSLYRARPDMSISLVRGITNPEMIEKILAAIHEECADQKTGKIDFSFSSALVKMLNENVFSGNLPDLYNHCMSASIVVTVDTGPGHLINEGIRKHGTTKPTPKLISLMGISAFNPLYYRLDCGETFLADGSIKTLPIEPVIKSTVEGLKNKPTQPQRKNRS